MEKTIEMAYGEVRTILDILGKEYQVKIPNNVKKLFYNKNIKINKNIFYAKSIEDIEISKTALIIISILNLKYWEKDEKKLYDLKEIYSNNEKQYQEKINIYKQKDWLNNSKQIQSNNVQTALIVQENNSLFAKIKSIINKLFFRK